MTTVETISHHNDAADPPKVRTCTCGFVGPENLFAKNGNGSHYNRCKPCVNRKWQAYAENNREKYRATSKRWRQENPGSLFNNRMRKYGITGEDFARMLDAQGGVCAICKKPPEAQNLRNGARRETLHVDHSHTTGSVRGLLCHQCNVGLGMFGEDPAKLEAAFAYLKKAGS